MDKSVLKGLGLTNNEVEVYLTLLQSGSISVNEVAQRSGLHRQAVYDALDRLLEKGFCSYVVMGGTKRFQGVHPQKLLEFLQQKQAGVAAILPDLLRLTALPEEGTVVEVFKGKGVVRTVYRDVIKSLEQQPGEVLITGVDERKFMEEDRVALIQHLRRLRKLKRHERVLVKEGDTLFVEGSQTTYRWIPSAFFSTLPIYVYGATLAIVIWGNPNYAIIIENKDLADAYRKQFNLLWKMAKKVPQEQKRKGSSGQAR